MSGRQQWHWVKVSAPGVSAGTAARRSGRLRWIEDRWTKRGGADDGRRRLRGFHAAATIRAPARRSRARAAGARTTVRPTGDHWLAVARFLVAVGVSAVLCLLLYRFAAPGLPVPTDVVGYPTFINFNSERYLFWPYRLTVFAFPLFAIVGYALLARFGPLRSRGPRPAKRTIELVEPIPAAPSHARPGLVGRPAAGAAAGGGGRRSVRYPYRTHGSSRRRRGRGICGAGRRRRRYMGAPH